jgi:hypothetical protein
MDHDEMDILESEEEKNALQTKIKSLEEQLIDCQSKLDFALKTLENIRDRELAFLRKLDEKRS